MNIAARRCANTAKPGATKKAHCSTQAQVSKDAENDNFDAGTALENLRAEVVDIEALVRATDAAAEALPAPTTDHRRVVFGRIQSLTTKTSDQASASLRFAIAQVAALTAQTEARRKAAAAEGGGSYRHAR